MDEEGSSRIEIEQFSQHEVDTENQKYQFTETFDHTDDILPFEFRHIRNGPRSVRPEIYKVATILSSQYHMLWS